MNECINLRPRSKERGFCCTEYFTLTFQEEYRLFTESTAAVPLPCGILSLRGKDVLDFLQRLSTNDVLTVNQNKLQTTLLVNEKAKLVDAVTVLKAGGEFFLVLESGDAPKIEGWLNKFLFSEDVQLKNISDEYEHYLVMDSGGGFQRQFNIDVTNEGCWSGVRTPSQIKAVETSSQADAISFRDCKWNLPVFHILLRKGETANGFSSMFQDIPILSEISEAVETFRIENSIPKYGKELTEQVNPLEAGLERFISWTKGCYIGQEVIARIDTYKKLQRKLMGFIFKAGEEVQFSPGKLYNGQEEVGWITSYAWSPRFKQHIALGYLKTNVTAEQIEMKSETNGILIRVKVIRNTFNDEL